jgi:signal transduction histidine kinase
VKPTRTTESNRIRSALAIFIGCGYIAYFAVSYVELGRDAHVVAAWWTPIAVTLAFVPGLALLACGLFAPIRITRAAAAVCAVSYLVCVVLWLSAWNGAHVDADRGTWLYSFPGLATLAACLVWRWPWVLIHLVSVSVLANVANTLGRSTAYAMTYLPLDVASGISFSALFVGAALSAIRTGKKLDEARADAYTAATRESEMATRATERARYDRIVHDNVLYTLLLASKDVAISRLAASAAGALDALADRNGGDAIEVTLTASGVLNSLRQTLESIEEGVQIYSDVAADADQAQYPRPVLRAFEGAASEALRNSIEHAGPTASREIVITLESHAIDIVIADDGVGFDPNEIPPGRLGVRGSIIECMHAVDGGSASVNSIPSIVTAAHLRWDRP